jgi:NADH dehydrogenase
MTDNPKIVIIGAGFGGIELAKALRKMPVEVLLIDQNNYHNFQPLMYQVATGGLEPGSIAYPVRRIFRSYKNITFRMAEVLEVNLAGNQLQTSIGAIPFDYLVIATGSQNNFFNFEPVKDKLLTLKSIPDALNLRSFIFQNLEKALANRGDETLEEIINVAIVGGGPAGLELAGALAEMKKYVLPKDFPELDLSKMSINLYEAAPELLGAMSEEASAKSLEYLQKLGVNVFLNAMVKSYDKGQVTLADGTTFLTDTVIWTAGVKGAPIKGLPADAIIGGNRISINEFNQILGTKNCFAIGDVAAHISTDDSKGLPMLAPVAQQQGKHLAQNLLKMLDEKPLIPFKYKNKGVMATIGRKKAVVDLPHYKFQGGFAWVVWMFIHIFSLVGFRNKAVAFFDWLMNYFSYDRPLGLIIRPFSRSK